MRNAVLLPNGLVLTTDNSAGIGEKVDDIVRVEDEIVAYFATRVALLEQWSADAHPISVIVHNFTGNKSWDKYVAGIEKAFQEIEWPRPTITGSTESNMETMQSAMAVTMIGEKRWASESEITWFVYGKPCVGQEVMDHADKIADLKKIWNAMEKGFVRQVWPVGSNGIAGECVRLGLRGEITGWDITKSAGPATSVLLGVPSERIKDAKNHFEKYFEEIR
ncbi:hypothetical protein AM499_12595 [Bacillus sp. FJAT-22090]|uniref:hypothetical protein n=1 Tax=Bacillus sp. FJAT-22090 TaxID=1581038 RepID=UPI0006B03177|nr:hypothetical protein [Bacillus sp. FJAT-22090]ALC86575.1 hypothetical protein AM499_12595 [Bacillus sp. FJAT-22090]